jgi:hypothetical protein
MLRRSKARPVVVMSYQPNGECRGKTGRLGSHNKSGNYEKYITTAEASRLGRADWPSKVEAPNGTAILPHIYRVIRDAI